MSENIFKEIYAKVISLFKQTEKEDNAKDIAKNRLRVVLMQDRTNLTPDLLERMRKELIELLSKYVEMDKEALELNFDQEGDQMALMLSIPVIRAKDEAEIEKALAEKDEEEEDDNDNSEEEKDEENPEETSDENESSEEEEESKDENSEETEEEKEREGDENTEETPEPDSEESETADEQSEEEKPKKEKKNK